METPEMETPSPPSPPSPPAASYVAASALRTSSSAGNALQDPRRSMTLVPCRPTGPRQRTDMGRRQSCAMCSTDMLDVLSEHGERDGHEPA
eukprot:38295-Rhodomonas_salina.1